jgi:hypothetical protein
MFTLSEESIVDNYNKFIKLIEADSRRSELLSMYEALGDALLSAPASSRSYYHNCYPGGYLEYVLRVVDTSLKLAGTYKELGGGIDFTKQELIFVALHHAVGKLGTVEGPNYIPQDSDWHRKRGELYKLNDNIQYFKIADRTLMLLQKYGISLTEKEWLAIKLSDGMYEDSNKSYFLSYGPASITTNLPHVLHWATNITTSIQKQKNEFKAG